MPDDLNNQGPINPSASSDYLNTVDNRSDLTGATGVRALH